MAHLLCRTIDAKPTDALCFLNQVGIFYGEHSAIACGYMFDGLE